MLNRMLGMIYLLMNKGTVTAGELAERFEVSVRTIYRDVEALSMAGIPVYAKKGKNGGICLTEEFVLNKMLVSQKEQQEILAALASLKETGVGQSGEILNKLGDFFKTEAQNWVAIDFSDWSGRRGELYEQLREAILNRHVISFDYYGKYGEMSGRTVEPIQLLFKEYTWYVRAFCRVRQDMRLFKVMRMKRVRVLEETFTPVSAADRERAFRIGEDEKLMEESNGLVRIVLWIHNREAYRIYDRFEEEEITRLPDGNFRVEIDSLPDDWIYGVILSFGPSARVLEPEWVQKEIHNRICEMKKFYEGV
ncbi:MAG: YafY family transcriptional regulator [Lachnospiraceae bacterium]|jgi:predicted DNA-binding transcriptional regulator YafY|nr:YafY family transcriptional regulator [Lachnospiraceae bacterium]